MIDILGTLVSDVVDRAIARIERAAFASSAMHALLAHHFEAFQRATEENRSVYTLAKTAWDHADAMVEVRQALDANRLAGCLADDTQEVPPVVLGAGAEGVEAVGA